MFDPLNPFELVQDELRQRTESGYDVDALEARFAQTRPSDEVSLEAIFSELQVAPRVADWQFEEPESLEEIIDSMPGESLERPGVFDLEDQVLGGWLGRIAGCNLGKPVEWGDHWTSDHIAAYLKLAGAYPLRDYIPVLDPMPDEFVLRENWPETTLGRVRGSARDDDIDYAILGLHMLERHGAGLTPRTVAEHWLDLLPYGQVFTAERAAYTNLVRGVPLEMVGSVRNPYREWIGALIRGDIFGWVLPGRPAEAVRLAFQDASLSHTGNGVYGELWSAALVSCAFAAGSAREALERSLGFVPARSRLAFALRDVMAMHAAGTSWEQALAGIQAGYGHYSWVHTVNNAAVIAAGLLWGDGDYASTVGLTVQGGWDTDSNAATAGSVAGVMCGARALPDKLVAPLEDTTRSALFGFDNSRISDLAARTVRLARSDLRPTDARRGLGVPAVR